MYGHESWMMKTARKGEKDSFEMNGFQRIKVDQIRPKLALEVKMTQLRLLYFHEKRKLIGQDSPTGKSERQ